MSSFISKTGKLHCHILIPKYLHYLRSIKLKSSLLVLTCPMDTLNMLHFKGLACFT